MHLARKYLRKDSPLRQACRLSLEVWDTAPSEYIVGQSVPRHGDQSSFEGVPDPVQIS